MNGCLWGELARPVVFAVPPQNFIEARPLPLATGVTVSTGDLEQSRPPVANGAAVVDSLNNGKNFLEAMTDKVSCWMERWSRKTRCYQLTADDTQKTLLLYDGKPSRLHPTRSSCLLPSLPLLRHFPRTYKQHPTSHQKIRKSVVICNSFK